VGGTCGTHGRREENVEGLGGKTRKEKKHLEDQGVDVRTRAECLRQIGWGVRVDPVGSIGASGGLL
jgi:hypothetical protein